MKQTLYDYITQDISCPICNNKIKYNIHSINKNVLFKVNNNEIIIPSLKLIINTKNNTFSIKSNEIPELFIFKFCCNFNSLSNNILNENFRLNLVYDTYNYYKIVYNNNTYIINKNENETIVNINSQRFKLKYINLHKLKLKQIINKITKLISIL